MDDNRVAENVFEYDMHKIGARASEVHDLFVGLGREDVLTNKVEMDRTIGK